MSELVSASAPGKLMVSGEYAVLEGALAVVASVDVRVFARWVKSTGIALPPEAAAARKLAEEAYGAIDMELAIDASDLRRSGQKLGLGSSAAAAAAAAAAVVASHGHDLNDPAIRRRVFDLALAGHKAIAPEGSGADVAAAALGGFVRFQLVGADKRAVAESVQFPESLVQRVVWTSKEARTSEFVRAVRAFEAASPTGYAALRDSLRAGAQRFAEAIERGDAAGILAATTAYHDGMKGLGEGAGVPIVTRELAEIARLAAQHGGAAKPSGAGGGDVALAFFPDAERADAFDRACRASDLGLSPLDLTLGSVGVRAE